MQATVSKLSEAFNEHLFEKNLGTAPLWKVRQSFGLFGPNDAHSGLAGHPASPPGGLARVACFRQNPLAMTTQAFTPRRSAHALIVSST